MALFFCEILLKPGVLAPAEENKFVSKIVTLSQGTYKKIRSSCFKLLRSFHPKVSNYRNLMLEGLKDSDPTVRWEALLSYETYCYPKEVTPLEKFEHDNYCAEMNMSGPLNYELRNLALETIEKVIGENFKKTEKLELTDNKEVSFYWDWTPYHKWKNTWFLNGVGHQLSNFSSSLCQSIAHKIRF